MHMLETPDMNIRVNAERQGRFVHVQIGLMVTPEVATEMIEGIRAMREQIPGAELSERTKFVDGITAEVAKCASAIMAGPEKK